MNVQLSEASQVYSKETKKSACISFQGNGVYFASHVGALISLLENNYVPQFATGGSSGAILASVARALVENPSLTGPDGTFEARHAAVLLASSAPVIESVLFLPRFTRPLDWMDSLDVFLSGSALGVLRADPSDALVHAESIIGQATLVIDFFRTVDFSKVVMERELSLRESKISGLWKDFALAILVSPEEFANAVFTPRDLLVEQNAEKLIAVQDRFFKLFKSKQTQLTTTKPVKLRGTTCSWATTNCFVLILKSVEKSFSQSYSMQSKTWRASTHWLLHCLAIFFLLTLIVFIVLLRGSIQEPTVRLIYPPTL